MRKKTVFIILIVIIVFTVLLNWPKITDFFKLERVRVVKYFPFSEDDSLREWEEKIFKGKVLYSIEKRDYQSFVLASSNQTASAMYYRIKLNMADSPVISWKWNAKKFPVKNKSENLEDAEQDDFVARVYVIFPSLFLINSKALEYIWTESIPEGTIRPSPYSKSLRLIVVECGKRPEEEWVAEERDIYEDYVAAFGEEPMSNIGAVAFMTDADSTGSSAESFYDEIKIGYKGGGR